MLVKTRVGRRIVFTVYARMNAWGDTESRSGPWSNLARTEVVRRELPRLLQRLGVSTLLDVPCGDGYWMRFVDHSLDRYVGADIVPNLVKRLQRSARPNEEYVCLDAITDPLPRVDAILSRDFFIHLSRRHIARAVENMRRSGSRYLIASTYTEAENFDIVTGQWRPVNLSAEPFNFGPPVEFIEEDPLGVGKRPDKRLGVWRLETLPSLLG